jgi:predicted ATPase
VRDPATPGLAAAIDGGDPEAIYAGLLGLFTDGNTWVFAVEDVHWADGATLDVLLSRDAVAVLAAGGGVNADELYRLTGGNPFFVTEVLAVGPETLGHRGLPRSVSEAVWGRLARLSAPARDSAQAAAVCGPRASAQLLEKVHPGATAALGECLDTGVLCADGAVVAFSP